MKITTHFDARLPLSCMTTGAALGLALLLAGCAPGSDGPQGGAGNPGEMGTVGAAGAMGTPGAPGMQGVAGVAGPAGSPGLVQAFTTAPGTNVVIPADNAFHPIVTLNLPGSAAGTYLLTFSLKLYNNSNSLDDGNCHVTNAGVAVPGSFDWNLAPAGVTETAIYVTGTVPITVPAAGTALAVVCVGSLPTGTTSPNMTAIQVSHVTVL